MPTEFPKFIFISGGVISGLGKGVTASSVGLLLKSAGYRVSIMKADMYLNIDAGTMNPLEHGEVFVTADGVETDQDLGHYERFLNEDLTKDNYFTMGQIYKNVLDKERRLGYEGKCVEGHIHIPEEILSKIEKTAENTKSEILICEIGGTIGEYQNMMFFEAVRRLKQRIPDNVMLIHVVYLPIPKFLGEMKSKPAQSSVYELYRLGLWPDFLVCRAETEVDEKRKKTISFNTGVRLDHIISNPDLPSIYKLPQLFIEQQFDKKILETLKLKPITSDYSKWDEFVSKIDNSNTDHLLTDHTKKEVKIAIAGKYFTSGNFSLEDSYICVIEAIKHAAWYLGLKPIIQWFDVEKFEDPNKRKEIIEEVDKYDGIIIPQGWGSRGVEGKIQAVKYARENKKPYLGLCFGMQMGVIEYTRDVLGLKQANTTEANPETPDPVIHVMPNQAEYIKKHQYGGTIRLGNWPCKLLSGSLLKKSYELMGINDDVIQERHRHRYEVNNDYREQLSKAGLVFSGVSEDGQLVEAIELNQKDHPFFLATQFHPEYKSRPLLPHPIFVAFIKACYKKR